MSNAKSTADNDTNIKTSIQDFLCSNKEKLNELFNNYNNSLKLLQIKEFAEHELSYEKRSSIDILILTATDVETFVLLNEMRKHNDVIEKIRAADGRAFHIGKLGCYNVVHIQTAMGNEAKESVLLSIDKWNPKLIVSLGIAYGKNTQKHQLGDVLFPTVIISTGGGKFSKGKLLLNKNIWIPNTDKYIRNLVDDITKFPRQKYGFLVHSGTMIAADYVIDDKKIKDILLKSAEHFNVIGGEMEAYSIFQAAYDNKVNHCFVLKGVCDWAENKNDYLSDDENEKDKIQLFAANNALTVLLDLMSHSEDFKRIGIFSHEHRIAIDLIKLRLQQYPQLGNLVADTKQAFQDILKIHFDLYDDDEIREFLDNLKAYEFCDKDNNLTDKGVLLLYSLWN